jgi:hypothetical protein
MGLLLRAIQIKMFFHKTLHQKCSSAEDFELPATPEDPGPITMSLFAAEHNKNTLRGTELWQGSLARPA